MNLDRRAVAIRGAICGVLQQLADELGDLADLSRSGDDGVSRLQPTYPGCAPVAWDERRTDDWAAYLTLGMATELRVLTSPDQSPAVAADTVAAHVARVIAGDFRELVWSFRRTGRPVAANGWVRDHAGAAWRPVGDRARPLPVLRTLLYDHGAYDYVAYDPPLWDRVLATLHDHGGTFFDADEVERARAWTQSPEGSRLAREYLDADPASARERRLRATIEAAIRS